jgi:hypothetical protein
VHFPRTFRCLSAAPLKVLKRAARRSQGTQQFCDAPATGITAITTIRRSLQSNQLNHRWYGMSQQRARFPQPGLGLVGSRVPLTEQSLWGSCLSLRVQRMPVTTLMPSVPSVSLWPACPWCSTQMKLTTITPREDDTEDRTFECPRCHQFKTWTFSSW